jgi:hypothetical protein
MTGVQLQDGADVSTDKNKKVTAASLEQSFHDGLHDAYANVGEE